jgi:hypothetical protein
MQLFLDVMQLLLYIQAHLLHMKNRINKTKRLLCAVAPLPALCFAQEPFSAKQEIASHSGYANMLEETGGLTLPAGSYKRKLCSGISWDVRYCYHLKYRASAGSLYSAFTSGVRHAAGSDRLYIRYMAPQFRLDCLDRGPWRIQLTAGMGYIHYLNNSKVYGKDRKATGGRLAVNAGLQAAYLIHPHWGVSIEAGDIASAVILHPQEGATTAITDVLWNGEKLPDGTAAITRLDTKEKIISGRFGAGSITEGRFDAYYTALQPCASSFTSPPSRPII